MSLQHLRFSTLLALAGVTLAATAALAEPARPQYQGQTHSARGTSSAAPTVGVTAHPQFVESSYGAQSAAEPMSATGQTHSAQVIPGAEPTVGATVHPQFLQAS
jgi:hypothetical protein